MPYQPVTKGQMLHGQISTQKKKAQWLLQIIIWQIARATGTLYNNRSFKRRTATTYVGCNRSIKVTLSGIALTSRYCFDEELSHFCCTEQSADISEPSVGPAPDELMGICLCREAAARVKECLSALQSCMQNQRPVMAHSGGGLPPGQRASVGIMLRPLRCSET